MKRQHWLDDASEMPAKSARAADDKPQDFDLNATPRGFDLNAPVPEEDWAPGESSSAQQEEVKEPEAWKTGPAAAVLKHTMEPAASLGIEEDLDVLHSLWSVLRDPDRLDETLSSLCEEVGRHPSSPPRYQYLACMYLSKKLPVAFSLPRTYKVLLSFLEPSGPPSGPAGAIKKQSLLPVFATRLLFRAFADEVEWPLDFVKVYLEDAISYRHWVDSEHCKEFTANVVTAFRDDGQDIAIGEDVQGSDAPKGDSSSAGVVTVKKRYIQEACRQKARVEFVEALKRHLRSPSVKETPRLVLRVFMLGLCYEEVRLLASTLLESWLNNPIHLRAGMVLLERLIHHTNTTCSQDLEVVANLVNLRLHPQGTGQIKNSLNNLYPDIVSQVVQKRPEYCTHAIKMFLITEMKQKSGQSFKGIITVLKAIPDPKSPERELASAMKELLAHEEYSTLLRDVSSRLMKQLSREISPCLLARALLEPWPQIKEIEAPNRLAWLKEVADLACHLLIHAAGALVSVEGLISAISEKDESELPKTKNEQIQAFSMDVMTFQVEALTWCTEIPNACLPQMTSYEFSSLVKKLQFLEPLEAYALTNASTDMEINSFQLVAYCSHASEEILARVILMGISNQFSMLQSDALSIIEKLIWRAAAPKSHVLGALFADNNQLPAAIMKLSSFNLSSALPQPVQGVMKDMYWRSCLVILVIAVWNPGSIGKSVWDNIPALKYLLQCLLTEKTDFGEEEDEAEMDTQAEEAAERMLAEVNPSSFSWSAEQWKGNVMFFSHATAVTKPPKYVLEELAEINATYQLGRRLRACKNPVFFTSTLSSQNFRQAWDWIKKIEATEPEVLGMIPLDWQAEVIFMHEMSNFKRRQPKFNLENLYSNIHKVLKEENPSAGTEVERAIEFLTKKLASANSIARLCARKILSGIVSYGKPNAETERSGNDVCSFVEHIEAFHAAPYMIKFMIPAIEKALSLESSVHVVRAYLLFLKKHLSQQAFCSCISRFVIDRKMICTVLLRMETIDQAGTMSGLFLESFSTALDNWKQGEPEWEEADLPKASLISGVSNWKVPIITLEAILEILVFISSHGGDSDESPFLKIVNTLFPSTNSDASTVVLKEPGIPFITAAQAMSLARVKNSRLFKAGLSILGVNEKLQLLQELGLCDEARCFIYTELANLPSGSLELSSVSNWQRIMLKPVFERNAALSVCPMEVDHAEPECEVSKSSNELALASDLDTPEPDTSKEYTRFRDLLYLFSVEATEEGLLTILKSLELFAVNGDEIPLRQFLVHFPFNIISDALSASREASVSSSLSKISSHLRNRTGSSVVIAARKAIDSLQNQLSGNLSGEKNLDHPHLSGVVRQRFAVIFQGVISKLRTSIEAGDDYSKLISILEFIEPDAFFKEHLLSLTNSLSSAEQITPLILKHVIRYFRRPSFLCFEQSNWRSVVENFSLEQPLSEQLRVSAALLLDFLHWCKDVIRIGSSFSILLANLAVLSCSAGNSKRVAKRIIELASASCVFNSVVKQIGAWSDESRVHIRDAAAELGCTLYMLHPVSVSSIIDRFSAGHCLVSALNTSQTSVFHRVSRRALVSVFSNSSNVGAPAFCYYLARKHPVVLIRHLSTVRLLLRENVIKIKDASKELRTSLARMLVFTVDLLNAIRPSLLFEDSLLSRHQTEFESVLLVLIEVLETLEPSDHQHFGKFVNQLGELLCNCISAGGRFSEFTRSHGRILVPASQKLSRARKLVQLGQLIEQGAKAFEDAVEMPLDKLDGVRMTLTRFAALETGSPPRRWDLMGVEDEFGAHNLLATLADLERASTHLPRLLVGMEDAIVGLMRVENDDVRERAYALAGRSLQHNNSSSRTFALEVLQQLKSPSGIAHLGSITKHLVEFFHYFEELREDILMQLFRNGGKNASSCLERIFCEASELCGS